jgi:fungal STAND N-terminal Goodbye domain
MLIILGYRPAPSRGECCSRSSHGPTNNAITPPLHGAYMSSTGHLHQSSAKCGGLHSLAPSASLTLPSNFTLNPCSHSPNSIPSHSEPKNVDSSIIFMSSTAQVTSPTSNFQYIINVALADYTETTGIDLSETPFATAIKRSNSPEAILQLLHEREKTFKEYRRKGNRKLINCLTPAVKVFKVFSGILDNAINNLQVSRACQPVILLTATSSDPTLTGRRLVCCH